MREWHPEYYQMERAIRNPSYDIAGRSSIRWYTCTEKSCRGEAEQCGSNVRKHSTTTLSTA